FGDYDVDGATSSALFKRFFDSLGVNSSIFIPDRINDGYGPNSSIFQRLKYDDTDLVITVDCGTTSFDAFDTAEDIGLKVIIVDHHLSSEILPKAFAIVNPNRIDETTIYKNLAAVGVCFLVAVATVSVLKERNYFMNQNPPNLLNLLDLVAVGTVCDVVALEGINRAFVVQGLKILEKRSNVGLSSLIDISRLNEVPTAYHLGYILGPRINAGGRVGKSSHGAELLSTDDIDIATNLALELDQFNMERRAIENIIFDEAMLIAEQNDDNPMQFIIGKSWHPGVIGIIASRIKEKYNKPTIVISILNGIGKASCRSISGIDLGAIVVNAKLLNLVENGGGHAMAAGFKHLLNENYLLYISNL
ncbi:MAG: single-stranded-DNA-specific exonuclease RecJ, partial [Rickettsiales bacterium]